MTSIQGIAGAGTTYAAAKAAGAPKKSEFGETAQTEKKEALSGGREVGEGAASPVGTKFSAIA